MFVLIVGGGKVGARLAEVLAEMGHQVRLVDKDPVRCAALERELGPVAVCGDGADLEVLRQAGVRRADALAAVTGSDEDNLVVALLGKREFHVPRVVARVNHPKNEWLFTPEMGVDVAVHPARVIAMLLEEELTLGDVVTLLKLQRGDVALVEVRLAPGAPAAHRRVGELALPPSAALTAVLRQGRVLVPHADLELLPEDEVLALTEVAGEGALQAALAGP